MKEESGRLGQSERFSGAEAEDNGQCTDGPHLPPPPGVYKPGQEAAVLPKRTLAVTQDGLALLPQR